MSMGIPSDGSYGVPEGIISSFPCTCSGGEYSIVQGLEIDEFSRAKIDASVAELARFRRGTALLPQLSNLATLLDVSPRELTDWFWVAYVDAYDWVVEPNVLGMGTYAAGDLMTTKPYISGSAYIDKMSDYCDGCAFRPETTCPITPLYWAFLARHADRLADNHRLAVPLAALRKRPAARRAEDARVFERVRAALERGERLSPEVVR